MGFHLKSRLGNNCPAKVHGLLRDSLGLGAQDCPIAKAGAKTMDGLSIHKAYLGSSLN
jgi:hypothetical protein